MAMKFTPEMDRKLKRLSIKYGSHPSGKQHCIMEAVSYIAGEPHSYDPMCVSNVISEFLIGINDSRTSDRERNKLKRVVPQIIGTRPTKKGMYEGQIAAYTKGYQKAEERRQRILEDAFGPNVDPVLGVEDPREISTRKAIEIVEKMAAVKNKA